MELILTDEDVQTISNVLLDCIGVTPAPEQLRELLRSNKTLLAEIYAWGASDTDVREQLAGFATMTLVGRSTPTFADTRAGFDSDAFYAQVETAARERDWLVADTA